MLILLYKSLFVKKLPELYERHVYFPLFKLHQYVEAKFYVVFNFCV